MTTRAFQHIPVHLSFARLRVTVTTSQPQPSLSAVGSTAHVVTENRRVPYHLTLTCHGVTLFIHERCFGACGSIGPVPLLQALSPSQLDPLAGFLRSRFLDA